MRDSLSIIVFFLSAVCVSQETSKGLPGRTQSRASFFLEQNPQVIFELHTQSSKFRRELRKSAQDDDSAAYPKTTSGGLFGITPETQPLLHGYRTPAFVKKNSLPDELATFEDFKVSLSSFTLHEATDGTISLLVEPGEVTQPVDYYVVEEDVALTELELMLYFGQASAAYERDINGKFDPKHFTSTFMSVDPKGSTTVQAPLRAQEESGKIVRWVPGSTLKYCILKWTFGDDTEKYERIKNNMNEACKAWGEACNIKFEHVIEGDDCPRGKSYPVDENGRRTVLFSVAHFDIGDTIAKAFFPNDPAYKRLLLIDPEEYFSTKIDKVGILRHELGHILGFRHEHISPDAPAWSSSFCKKESTKGSIPITAFDRASVMHYPCVKLLERGPLKSNLQLQITELDKIGASSIYGKVGEAGPSGHRFKDFSVD